MSMSTTSPPVPPGMVALTINDMIRVISHRPETYKLFDTEILPSLLTQHRTRLSFHVSQLPLFHASLQALHSSHDPDHVRGRQALIKRMEQSIDDIMDEEVELSVWAWLKATKVIMREIEESGCLSDDNQADFEDLERLRDDFEEDVWGVRGELEGVKMLMKSDGQDEEGIVHKRIGIVIGAILMLLMPLMVAYLSVDHGWILSARGL